MDKNGIVPRETSDFETRQGITVRPITTSSQKSITLTHTYINGNSWFIKFLTRCHINHRSWKDKAGPNRQLLKASKERVLYQIEVATGLDLERVNSAGAKGGTLTTGAQGCRFFSEECVAVISDLCTDQNREMVLLAHKQLSVILRIISLTQKIKVLQEALQRVCCRPRHEFSGA